MCDSNMHTGDLGSGTAFKIINNYISLIGVLTVSEALNIADKMNLGMKLLVDLINSSSGRCWVASRRIPSLGSPRMPPASHGCEGGFRIELGHIKVLRLGKKLAEMLGAKTFLDETALSVFAEAAAEPRYAGEESSG